MGYCTLSDIRKTMPDTDLIQLTDDTLPPSFIDQDNVDSAITAAGELIDSSLRGRYLLPLSPVPGLINTLAIDLVIYRLYSRRVKIIPPAGVENRHKTALQILAKIQAGTIDIGAVSVAIGETSAAGAAEFSSSGRIFNRDSLKDY